MLKEYASGVEFMGIHSPPVDEIARATSWSLSARYKYRRKDDALDIASSMLCTSVTFRLNGIS